MDEIDDLVLVGLSQRTAPVDVRERYAVGPEAAPGVLHELLASSDVDEAVVVSTCNRTEAFAMGPDGARTTALLRRSIFDGIDEEHVYTFRGVRAIMHLFRMSAGLDSMVVGESEILGQIKRSFEISKEAGAIGRALQPLFTQALSVGKRVRNETSIGEGSLSVARVGLDVAARALGRYDGKRATIIGAGETGVLVARHLLTSGVASITLLNRTQANAEAAAAELGPKVTAGGLDAMGAELQGAHIGVVCVDTSQELVTQAVLDRRALSRRDQPLVLLDLSVPRSVAPDVGQLDGVLLYDLDALLPIVAKNRADRGAAAEEVTSILVGEVHKFLSLRTFAAFSPAIEELKGRFRAERERLIDLVTHGQATPRELELAHAMEKHLLGLALGQLKESARHARSTEALDRAYRRFVDDLSERAE